jgi:hypothetical protein
MIRVSGSPRESLAVPAVLQPDDPVAERGPGDQVEPVDGCERLKLYDPFLEAVLTQRRLNIDREIGPVRAVTAVLVAVVTRSRRRQSSIGRESGDTVRETRRKEQGKDDPWGEPARILIRRHRLHY